MKRKEEISTSSDRLNIGREADLIFAPALTFYIAQGMNVSLDTQTCAVSAQSVETFTAAMDKQGTILTTVGTIESVIVPQLLEELAFNANSTDLLKRSHIVSSLRNWDVRRLRVMQCGRGVEALA